VAAKKSIIFSSKSISIMTFSSAMATGFEQVVQDLRQNLADHEHFVLSLHGEDSLFTRFNRAQVRQSGTVRDARYQLTLFKEQRNCRYEFPCTGAEIDRQQALQILNTLRVEMPGVPIDPYQVLPNGNAHSHQVKKGQLLAPDQVATAILNPVQDLDFTGIYAGGTVIRGYADSSGQQHWFATDTFTLDYSLFTADGQAVKGTLAGSDWLPAKYQSQIDTSRQQLAQLAQTPIVIKPGKYRTYLAPAAVADLVGMMSWGSLSESDMQQGQSSLAQLREGQQLSTLFTLHENFSTGLVPQFNHLGEMATLQLPLITNGQLVNTLINTRTAQEYQKVSNQANSSESLRAAEVETGQLAQEQILTELDTGLYLSNLHYLNWSDRQSGRITGMTRYACFWIENGEVIAPISNLRFDESLYNFWGDNLLAVTNFAEYAADTDSYGQRSLGGSWVPGMLIKDFTYTL
jgi:predicted Zn-dependent protease